MYQLRNRFHFIYVVIDVFLLTVTFYSHYLWRYNAGIWYSFLKISYWQSVNLLYFREYTLIFILWCIISLLCLNNFRLFTTNRQLGILSEWWLVVKALGIAVFPAVGAIFMLQLKMYSRLVFVSAWITSVVLLCAWRTGKRIYIRHRLAKGLGTIKVLVIGAGSVGQTVVEEIKRHPYLGFEIVGFLSDERNKDEIVFGYKVLGGYNDLEAVVKTKYIDEVFVTVPLERNLQERFISMGKQLGVGIKVVPELYEYIYGELKTYDLGYTHFLEYVSKGIHGTELGLKRAVDIIGAILLLILFLPVFIILGIMIKSEDGGPFLYISWRMGRKGRVFPFYKFRSMIVGADRMKDGLEDNKDVTGPVFKMRKDPRVTRIGRFMRRWSLDELPQLWNVIRGDMSLVGPRPPTPDEVEKYDLWQRRRLEVKPGITCLWQVRGRSNLSFYKWVKWDLWYIDNWSFWLDLRILLWTIPAVLKGEGAY